MRKIWGPLTEIEDLGVVAEQCLQCNAIKPCLLRSVSRGSHVLFMKMTSLTNESSCLCTECLTSFPCQRWRYTSVIPMAESRSIAIDELLHGTNPTLAERMELEEQIQELGGDTRFARAYEQLDGMRSGVLRSNLVKEVMAWNRLESEPRALLGEQITARARAFQFARQIAPGFPSGVGCLSSGLTALTVWSTFLWLPAVRHLLPGAGVVLAGFGAAAVVSYLSQIGRIRHWVRQELIPEAELANISLPAFLEVVDDLSGSRLEILEELWPLKVQIEAIRSALEVEKKLR